jgi:hypothetical protein
MSNTQSVYVEYKRQRLGEEPFWLGGKKWEFVTVENSRGWPDIGVYSFAEDRCYDYGFWRETYNLN